jgi:hypothetical protein
MTPFLLRAAFAVHIVITTIGATAAEPPILRCSGTLYLSAEYVPKPPGRSVTITDDIVTVDLDGKLVHGFLHGPLRISKIDEDAIYVWSSVKFRDGTEGNVQGSIDRTTGITKIISMRDRDAQSNQVSTMPFFYDLVCRRPKLF